MVDLLDPSWLALSIRGYTPQSVHQMDLTLQTTTVRHHCHNSMQINYITLIKSHYITNYIISENRLSKILDEHVTCVRKCLVIFRVRQSKVSVWRQEGVWQSKVSVPIGSVLINSNIASNVSSSRTRSSLLSCPKIAQDQKL